MCGVKPHGELGAATGGRPMRVLIKKSRTMNWIEINVMQNSQGLGREEKRGPGILAASGMAELDS